MFRIFLIMTLFASLLFSTSKTDTPSTVYVGNTLYIIYRVTDKDTVVNLNIEQRYSAGYDLKRSICDDPDTRTLVDTGYTITYVYVAPTKETILEVKTCQ